MFNPKSTKGWKAAVKEGAIPTTMAEKEIEEALHNGLAGASSIEDKSIPTFSRGELPHFAGMNTFMKAYALRYLDLASYRERGPIR
jgi:agmatinase